MPDTNAGGDRPSPTSPEAAESLVGLSETAETFAEPSETLAEARREGDINEGESQLDDAAERQARLEQAREAMWDTAASSGGDVEGLGVQEEETARIADHLVFPGTGMRELRAQGRVDEVIEQVANADVPSPTDNPDRFPPAEWPPDEQARQDARDRGTQASGGPDGNGASSEGRILPRSKQLLGEPWILAGACLGAGLVIGLSVRAIKERFGQQQTPGRSGAAEGAKVPSGRVAEVKEAAKDKVGEVKDAAKGKAAEAKESVEGKVDGVRDAVKAKAGEVKDAAKGKAAEAKESVEGKVDGVRDAVKAKAGEVKDTAKDKAGERVSTKDGGGGKAAGAKKPGNAKARDAASSDARQGGKQEAK